MATLSDCFVLRLGTRGSLLAQAQSGWVARQLEQAHPGLRVELTVVRTSGDQIAERPLHEFGGKGLFTKELEEALLAGSVDFAVHSLKDVPVTMPLVEQQALIVAAMPAREDPRDVLVSMAAYSLDALPKGAKVGTGSLRRRCQLLARRPDLQILPIRGNIDTRIRKLKSGAFDAVILAAAGLKRSGLFDHSIMRPIDADEMLPAAAQGALSLQCRRDDDRTRSLLGALMDPATEVRITAERELVRLLNGDCHSPIAAFAELRQDELTLRAAVGARGGDTPVLTAASSGPAANPGAVAQQVFDILRQQNVMQLLHGDQSSRKS
jgi:hydroxymethylbilane synthase